VSLGAWTREDFDPAPGPVVVAGLASVTGTEASRIVAAVLMFKHVAGNQPYVWLFRIAGMDSDTAAGRWLAGPESRCAEPPVATELAEIPAVMVKRKVVDQCQPEYVVPLDDRTVAIIVDDGAYAGNAASETPVPYRSHSDIATLVMWLRENLPDIPLEEGGPPQQNR
jgi:hypothetical protein